MTHEPDVFIVAFHLHELGHLLVARALGIKASTVTIGLGPVIAKFNDRFGTCWRLGLLPRSAADVVSSMARLRGHLNRAMEPTPNNRSAVYLCGDARLSWQGRFPMWHWQALCFRSSILGAGTYPLRISRNPISVFRCSKPDFQWQLRFSSFCQFFRWAEGG